MLVFPKISLRQIFFFLRHQQNSLSLCLPSGLDEMWKSSDFTFFSKAHIFQLYQDNGMVIMKGCMQWNPVNNRKDFCHWESNLGMLDQQT